MCGGIMTTLAPMVATTVSGAKARHYRANGWWRDQTFVDDLTKWATLRPDQPALITGRDGGVVTLTYGELQRHVRRVAAGLLELGVGSGDVVAYQLPDWWEHVALLLACMKVGATAQPMTTDLREREMVRVLGCTNATVVVTVDSWQGFDAGRAVADLQPQLPALRHRVVYGDAAACGAVDFRTQFLDRPDTSVRTPRLDPDKVCLVLFTSGSTGEAKGVLHTFNTLYAGTSSMTSVVTGGDPTNDRAAATQRISHIAGPLWTVFGPLLTGGAGVLHDSPDADVLLDLMVHARATRLLTTPNRLALLVVAAKARPRELPSLRAVVSGGAPIPERLVHAVRETFGVELRAAWGMTEQVVGTVVPADAPPGWSAFSDGAPVPGIELDIDLPDGDESGTGELLVRGASMCVGTMLRDIGDVTAICETGQEWFRTGDLARHDGKGGIRLVGRVADRVINRGYSSLMIPVRDVEEELLQHPGISDAAVIAVPGGEFEDVCAVIVPTGVPPTLEQLRAHLTERGMTEWYHPNRLEVLDALPRDPLGKVRKYQLRDRFS
jgi:cyclohexanecarboxylate-CoA ligase